MLRFAVGILAKKKKKKEYVNKVKLIIVGYAR